MNRYKTILVDDESKSSDILKYLIERHCPSIQIIGVFAKASTALEFIKENTIDLLFLDIQMPEMDGFQVLDQLPIIDFKVVFVTARDEFAIKAFKYYAIDYLLKPVAVGELKALTTRLEHMHAYTKNDYHQIMQKFDWSSHKTIRHLAVPTSKGVEFVKIDDILRLEADSNYTHVIRINGKNVYAAKTLKHFEGLLPSSDFFRPHQSHIINVNRITRFIRGDGGSIIMEDNKEIALARSKRQEFISRFGL